MRVSIEPGKASGKVIAPPSKSMAHRALISACLSRGVSIIHNISLCDDVKATAYCLKALGAEIQFDDKTVSVSGMRGSLQEGDLNCNESGSTLRFLLPICASDGKERRIYCAPRLLERPLDSYEHLFSDKGVKLRRYENYITVCGYLKSGNYKIEGNISSQFISGLLFALSYIEGESTIEIIPPIESRPYIEMTLSCLRDFGMFWHWSGGNKLIKETTCNLTGRDYTVEGDYSNAAFIDSLNVLGGSAVISGLKRESLQGDRIYREYFKKLEEKSKDAINVADCPDLAPILMSVAAYIGNGRLSGTARLKIKESDRGTVMAEELSKFGIKCEVDENSIEINGTLQKPSEILCGHNDHRIVMALSVLMTVTGGVIEGAEAINKSFPDFFEMLGNLGIKVEIKE